MDPATLLTILIMLPLTVALIVGMERASMRWHHSAKIRNGQQLGPVQHIGPFGARFRHHLWRVLIILVPLAATLIVLRSGLPE